MTHFKRGGTLGSIYRQFKSGIGRRRERLQYIRRIGTFDAHYDDLVKQMYSREQTSFEDRVECLTQYFATSFFAHCSDDRTRAYFKGEFSFQPADADAIEGFSRFSPFLAVLANKYDGGKVKLLDGQEVDLVAALTQAFVQGTRISSKGYWGDFVDYDQKVAEAADIALAIWTTKPLIWDKLKEQDRENIVKWLVSATEVKVADNNWHIFPFFISLVLSKLNPDISPIDSHYQKIKAMYVGKGWFTDGGEQNFDYYNAWAFHYSLFWIEKISPDYDVEFIHKARAEFVKDYQYFFAEDGFPFFGRSMCYRLSLPAPLIASYISKDDVLSAGLVKRAFDSLWRHFIAKGALKYGVPTQGYYGQDLRFLDDYSGPASSLWSLRSLILLCLIPDDDPFWSSDFEKLPVENRDYELNLGVISRVLIGQKDTGDTKVVNLHSNQTELPVIKRVSWLRKLRCLLFCQIYRPSNIDVKQNLKEYVSSQPIVHSNWES